MFGISFSEIILILVISVIVFGPKQLGQIARTIGLLIRTLKTNVDKLKQEIYHETGVTELIQTKEEIINSSITIKNELHDIIIRPTHKRKKSIETEQPELFPNSTENDL